MDTEGDNQPRTDLGGHGKAGNWAALSTEQKSKK